MRTVLLFIMILATTGCGMGMDAWIHDDVNDDFTKQSFDQKALQEDLAYLQTQMAARHPVYHELTDEKAINEKFATMSSKIKNEMSRGEYFRLIGTINPYFRDGHSLLFPLLAEGTYAEDKKQNLFPFGVFTQNHSLYINKVYKNKSTGALIEKGTKVVSINGVAGETILKQLAEYGHGETANLRMHMSTLLFHYWLNAIYEWRGNFKLVLEHDNKQETMMLSSHGNWESEQNKLSDNWLKIIANQNAYLKLGTFDVDEESGFEDFVEDAFAKIKEMKVAKLIIDVRGNTGGQSDAGAEVISYLTDKKLNQASSVIEKLSNDNNGLFGYKGKPGEIIELDVIGSQIIEPVEPSKRFKGEVVVLIDEMTYSAGIVFATTLQDHKVAKLVGQPTGGHANQTGNLNPFYLPNTKLLVLAPSRYITRVSGDTSKQSIQPDVIVNKGKDTTVDMTLQVSQELFSN
ncbi:S41 family peptidase [Shewanella sp. 10N.286.52.B9]|uniref:S41 family peptidase n=1 Tax=Shewanella sp. 10N.286.52.B9 TaxID=1880837 RepID=UPI000C850E33|nr:S41 family peptidase [Shewanella sp. 10N.286.52.B9]